MLNRLERRLVMKRESTFEYEGKKYKLPGISYRTWWREQSPVKLPDGTFLVVGWRGKPPQPTIFTAVQERPTEWYEAQEANA